MTVWQCIIIYMTRRSFAQREESGLRPNEHDTNARIENSIAGSVADITIHCSGRVWVALPHDVFACSIFACSIKLGQAD
eukprot:COSAG05_NODE_2417_length_3089_cov_1.909365_2_plen_79_part_00